MSSKYPRHLPHARYSGTCAECHGAILEGEPCHWSSERKQICDESCDAKLPGSKQPPSTPSKGPAAPQGSVDSKVVSDAEWEHLIAFLRQSVVLAAGKSVLPVEQANASLVGVAADFLHGDSVESVVTRLAMEPSEKSGAGDDEGQSLAFGWPILTFRNSEGSTSATPILVCSVTVSKSDEGALLVSRESDFGLNPALSAQDGLGLSLGQVLGELLEQQDSEQPRSYMVLIGEAAESVGVPMEGFENNVGTDLLEEEEGIYNASMVLRDPNLATAGLLKELETLEGRTDWRQTAAAALIDRVAVRTTSGVRRNSPMLGPLPTNLSQEEVIKGSFDSRLTVVTGPPGTGKSQVVVNLVANAWGREELVLLTSTNNAAVNVAVERAELLTTGLLLRTGNRDAREALPNKVTQIVGLSAAVKSEQWAIAESRLALSVKQRDEYLAHLEMFDDMETSQFEWALEEERLYNEVGLNVGAELADDVLVSVRGTLASIQRWPILKRLRLRQLGKRFGIVIRVDKCKVALDWLAVRIDNRDRITKLRALDEVLGDRMARLEELETAWREASRELINLRVSDSVDKNKKKFVSLAGAGYLGMVRSVEELSTAFRGWASTLLSLRSNFPLRAGLFDTVIIDEASQCHLANVLPAAYRAKRLVVVGDPNQLQPITSLTEKQETAVAVQNAFSQEEIERWHWSSVRDSSFDAFESVVGANEVKLLNEHYRCHPRIARWFNDAFYASQLEVLTDVADFDEDRRAISWTDVAGTATRPVGRSGSWVNVDEAQAVIAILKQETASGNTVGVVTPFAAQSDLIERLAVSEFGRDLLGEVDFRVGTSHRFQGDERDVMVFSPVIAPGIAPSAARWVERERRLINVAVSRARQRLHIVGSPQIANFNVPTLVSLRTFIENVTEQEEGRISPQFASEAEERLYVSMLEEGLNPLSKFNVQGYELDFAVFAGSRRFDIEVDGDQHRDEAGRSCRQDVVRDRILSRSGWMVMRVPAWECFEVPDTVARGLQDRIEMVAPAPEVP